MKIYQVVILSLLVLLGACSIDEDNNTTEVDMLELDIPEGFNFSLDKNVEVLIDLQSTDGSPIEGVTYNIYYPNSRGELKRLSRFATDESGIVDNYVTVPHYVNSLYVSGFMNTEEITISNGKVLYYFGANGNGREDGEYRLPSRSRSFSYLDDISYNWRGVPNPVMMEEVTVETLERIDTSLPERISLDESHPQYLEDGITTNLVIEDSSDVWLTFVTEGAGNTNSLGFYTYDLEDGPPADPSSLEHIIVFPNTSLSGSGGGLQPGMTLHLGKFGAGTVMGWFLVQDGWEWYDNVSETDLRFYSDRQYNPEDAEYNQHSVLLYDDEAELFLMAFEDLVRPYGDNDFNDAVFFATANPIENINRDNIPPIDIPVDSDGDGVNDPFDEFPDDPDRAYYHYYPAENENATIVFEDKWPAYGDYDLNDMVIDYQYEIVKNADNEIVDLNCNFVLNAAGAFYNNGFSVLLPFNAGNIQLTSSSDNIDPQLVADGDYVILDLFERTTSLTGLSQGVFFNTESDEPYYEPVSFSCELTLTDPVELDGLDFSFPFNPFMKVQGSSGHEVHLMNNPPTSRMNMELFMTEDDASDADNSEYYVSPINLPWGLNLPENWKYPQEKKSITETYFNFAAWAESGGESYSDWYTDIPSNYDEENIYNTP